MFGVVEEYARLAKILADQGYQGDLAVDLEGVYGVPLESVKPEGKGFSVQPKRWIVGRTWAWLENVRGLVRDYERLPENQEGMVYMAMIRLMRTNWVGRSDQDDLYRFDVSNRSRFDLTLSKIAKGANVNVELYALKRPWSQMLRRIGNLGFRQIRTADRNANLRLVRSSKRGGNRDEEIKLDRLDTGTYVIRVLPQTGNSRYRLRLAATQISDTPPPAPILDTVAPNATLSVTDLLTGGSNSHNFTVTYRDNIAVTVASLDDRDIQVTGANGFSQFATRVAIDNDSNGTPRTITYQITAPGGTWDNADNGVYTIALQANQVSDISNNLAAAGQLGNFQVSIDQTPSPPPPDTIAPTATLEATNRVPSGGDYTYEFTVTYSDNVAVDQTSLDNNDIQVSSANGYGQLATRTQVEVSSTNTLRVTYQVTAPDGVWDSNDNAIYNIVLRRNQVKDTNNNFIATTFLGNYQVNINPLALRPIQFSGASGTPGIDINAFNIETSLYDFDPDENIGFFRGAIQEFTIGVREANGTTTPRSLSNGDVRVSLLTESDITNLNTRIANSTSPYAFDFSDFSNSEISPTFDFSSGGVKYEVTFEGNPDVQFTFFTPLPDSNSSTRNLFTNSLSPLLTFNNVQGVVTAIEPNTGLLGAEVYGLNSRAPLNIAALSTNS
ncbi:MAG: transposase [Cyanobacteria bacterium CRU_2_1]|nr:transposase [Cyanobacteria bacterium CRU_2_1]